MRLIALQRPVDEEKLGHGAYDMRSRPPSTTTVEPVM